MSHPALDAHDANRTRGERIADRIVSAIGSWRFLGFQGLFILAWIGLNAVAWAWRWDPYPWVLLNLMLSLQAAYTGPILLLASKRLEARERALAHHDYGVNQRALELIEGLVERMAERQGVVPDTDLAEGETL